MDQISADPSLRGPLPPGDDVRSVQPSPIKAHGDVGSPPVMQGEPSRPGEVAALPTDQPVVQDTSVPPPSLGELIVGPQVMPWSRLLVRDHLSSSAQLRLLGVCTASRDIVLAEAKHATLQLPCADQAAPATLQAHKQALLTRGRQRTKLQLTASHADQLSHILSILEDSTTWLVGLGVQCGQALTASALEACGRACPNLRALTIHAPAHELPSPELFPKLKELSVNLSRPCGVSFWASSDQPLIERALRSMALYFRQLTHLTIHGVYEQEDPHLQLFSPNSIGSHLHTLHLDLELNDTLLGHIVQYAPAVEQLTVRGIQLCYDDHVQARVQWRQLQCRTGLLVSSLARLPHTPAGLQLILLVGSHGVFRLHCDITNNAQEAAAAAARIKEARCSIITGSTIRGARDRYAVILVPARQLGSVDQPAALRMALSLLRSCSMQLVPAIELHDWDMSSELVQELPGLPLWGCHLVYQPKRWLPEPQMYPDLLSHLPISFDSVELLVSDGYLTSGQAESICLGAPRNRTPEAPLKILLWWTLGDELLQALQHKVQLAAIPNVLVMDARDLWR